MQNTWSIWSCSDKCLITPNAVPNPDVAREPVLQCVSTFNLSAPTSCNICSAPSLPRALLSLKSLSSIPSISLISSILILSVSLSFDDKPLTNNVKCFAASIIFTAVGRAVVRY